MIVVDISNYGVVKTQFTPGMTLADLIKQIKEENKFRFRGTYSMQETNPHAPGRVMADSDIISDDRRYYLTAWLERADVNK